MIIKSISCSFILLILIVSCKTEQRESIKTDITEAKNNSSIEVISFWNHQRKGTNYFNKVPTKAWFDAAANANIKLIRFTYEKWEGERRDFLIGNADDYVGIIESDFQKLKFYLDYAHELNIKVVITPISLPGARWIQMNNGARDDRIWKEDKYRKSAIQFWSDLAIRLKDHPAIVGYTLVNEPHPELFYEKHSFWGKGFDEWYRNIQGGPGDLNLFYNQLVAAIRLVDRKTPIIIETGLFATPWAIEYLEPVDDAKVIYSFHMYEPYAFTTRRINKGRFAYPGKMYIEDLGKDFQLDHQGLWDFFNPVYEWTKKHNVPSNRIWVSEFGCDRTIEGAEQYLADVIDVFNKNKWHWSFYAFREDVWPAMDYELGTGKVIHTYWGYQDSSLLHLNYMEIYSKNQDSGLWNVFKKEFEE